MENVERLDGEQIEPPAPRPKKNNVFSDRNTRHGFFVDFPHRFLNTRFTQEMSMRSQKAMPTSRPITFTVDGEPVSAYEGETLAAAMTAAGKYVGRHTQQGKPRHVFCGMGVCFDCLAIVKGQGTVRACMTKVKDGMEVTSWPKNGLCAIDALPALASAPEGTLERQHCQLAVVGAGPGGLAAATTAARAGLNVMLLDERPEPGGQYYKQRGASLGEKSGDGRNREGAAAIAEAKAAGVRLLSGALVWRAQYDHGRITLSVLHDGKVFYLEPEQLVLATGAYDEPFPVPGWTLPGVMTVGGAQSLLRAYGAMPESPIALCGNGPLLLQLASELLKAGATISGIVSASAIALEKIPSFMGIACNSPSLAVEGASYLATILRHKVPLISGHVLVRVEGEERPERAIIAPADALGNPRLDKTRALPANTVCLGYGFMPSNELARQLGCDHGIPDSESRTIWAQRSLEGQSSLPNVYIVGEAGGIGGAKIALSQGTLAGLRIAERLTGHKAPADLLASTMRTLARNIAFQRHLNRAFDARPDALRIATPETHICRCEEVALQTLKNTIAQGVHDLGSLKRLTRAGMGRCQGRYCQDTLARLIEQETGTRVPSDAYLMPQAPTKPLPLVTLAVEKPEWGGHKRSDLHPLPQTRPGSTKLGDEDVIIIGSGVAGCATAFWLAKAGRSALVLDRGPVNGQASGGNAGSMHVQLLSFDFGQKAEGGGSPALKTLLLQRESAHMWADLQTELGGDFEIKTVGGLMMAENERDLGFLREKTAKERAAGIQVDVIDAAELRRIAPEVSPTMLGAAFCPEEGKINPLKGTQGLYLAAKSLGQRFLNNVEVLAITREDDHFRIETANGWFKARQVVNAAGAWASQISGMVGKPVPVHGAPLQMIVTEAVAPAVHHLLAHADRHLTMKQMQNGNFIIGGGWTAGYDATTSYPTCLRDSLEGNLWVARRVIPALDSVHVIRTWAALNINIDGAPIVGEMPGVPGFYNTVTSNGYTLGPIMGRITADLMINGKTHWDINGFTLERF